MALILLCGYPASGKTRFATDLQSRLESTSKSTIIIQDTNSSDPPTSRTSLYQTSTTEKTTRARLRTAVERALTPSTIVIVDSLNYIKGFRYELFCVAKTTSSKFCIVYCQQPQEICHQRDLTRVQEGNDAYGADLVNALIRRFEAPTGIVKWERPLFHLSPTEPDSLQTTLQAVVDLITTTGKSLTPTMATRNPDKLGSDILAVVDRVTRNVENTIISALHSGAGVGQKIFVPNANRHVRLHRKPKVSDVRGMRRAYLNLARMQPVNAATESDLTDEYIEYLNAQLKVKS